jgi:hypothetical protein
MARLRMSVSRSGLELTEVRCSFRPGAQGTQSCNYGRRRGLLKANGKDAWHEFSYGRASPIHMCRPDAPQFFNYVLRPAGFIGDCNVRSSLNVAGEFRTSKKYCLSLKTSGLERGPPLWFMF